MTRREELTTHTKESTPMSAKESKVTPAQREQNGAPNLTPAGGSNSSSIDPEGGWNGAPHLSPEGGNGDQRGEAK